MAAVTHFSMVGFPVASESDEAMSADVIRLAENCETLPLQGSHSLCVVSDASGAELWIGLDGKTAGSVEVKTFNPALRGKGKTKIEVTSDLSPREWKPFEYRIGAKFSGDETPLVLDLADPREAAKFASGATVQVDITAFADEITAHASEEAYYASQASQEVKFASNHFIPSGMFSTKPNEIKEPTAHAILAGEILEAELRQNELGKGGYWWILIRTYGDAVINVVADPATLKSKPTVGGIVSGSFWLSARLSNN